MSLVTVVGPRTHPVLYPLDETPKAVPKYFSGRTSYLRVRLAFHRYPQLIRAVFNRHRSGPSFGDYPHCNLAMGRSLGFGSTLTDMRGFPLDALFALAFAVAPFLQELNLPANVTRRFILQKARRHPRTNLWGSDCL